MLTKKLRIPYSSLSRIDQECRQCFHIQLLLLICKVLLNWNKYDLWLNKDVSFNYQLELFLKCSLYAIDTLTRWMKGKQLLKCMLRTFRISLKILFLYFYVCFPILCHLEIDSFQVWFFSLGLMELFPLIKLDRDHKNDVLILYFFMY